MTALTRRLLRLLPLPLLPLHLFGSACGSDAVNWPDTLELVHSTFPEVDQLSTDELAAWLADARRRPPLLLDAREPAEYEISHLPHAVRAAPDGSDLDRVLADVPTDQPVVLYCSVGYRSSSLARKLTQRGYEAVQNLDGSIFKWANEGRAVVREGQPVSEVHPFDDRWGVLLEESLRADP